MHSSSHWCVEGFMEDVRKHIEAIHPENFDYHDDPGLACVKNEFYQVTSLLAFKKVPYELM